MLLQLLTQRPRVTHSLFIKSWYVWRWCWRRCPQEILKQILASDYGRCPRRIAGYREDTGMTQEAASLVCGEFDTPKIPTRDTLNPVMLGQPLVQERVLGIQKL